MTEEELARILTFALRGHEADGTMYPGGSLRALQQLLSCVDELRKPCYCCSCSCQGGCRCAAQVLEKEVRG